MDSLAFGDNKVYMNEIFTVTSNFLCFCFKFGHSTVMLPSNIDLSCHDLTVKNMVIKIGQLPERFHAKIGIIFDWFMR